MKRVTIPLSAVILLFLISIVSASSISCNPSSINVNVNEGTTASTQTIICGNTGAANITGTSFGSFFSIPGSISVNSNTTSNIQIVFNSEPSGFYQGVLSFSDGINVPIALNVTPVQQQGGCQIGQSLVSYTQTIQSGTQMPLPKIIFNPTNCPGSLVLSPSSVSIQGGILTTNGQKPIFISSILSDGINLAIDTTGLNTQTYSSVLSINAFSKNFQIPFTIIVTAGTSPSSNFSVNNLPKCSLTNTILNLNSTYSLICTNIQPDVSIKPNVDTTYIEGLGPASTSNQFVWNFQPLQFGNTNIKADFFYQGVPVGLPYSQSIKISSSGAIAPGTNLNVIYIPLLSNAIAGQNVSIQIVDNNSNSLLTIGQLYINAQIITNTSLGTYQYAFQPFVNYSVRAHAEGYNDFVSSAALSIQPMTLNITPNAGDSSTQFTISTSFANASLFIDNVRESNPYNGLLADGVRNIFATAEGYQDINTTLNVDKSTVIINTPVLQSGQQVQVELSKNISWELDYQSSATQPTTQLSTGQGSMITFTPKSSGNYIIKNNLGHVIGQLPLQGFDWSNPFGISWWIIIGILVVIAVIVYFVKSSNSSSSSSGATPYGMPNLR